METLTELNAAAQSLETRAIILGITTTRIPLEGWEQLSSASGHPVPFWLRQLLSTHALYGIALEYRDRIQNWVRIFSFQSPDDFRKSFPPDSVYHSLLDHGYVPIGYEQDGNLWLIESTAGADGPVFLLEHSAWDGGTPSLGNGLIFAASRFALLMASMGISQLSYDHGVKRLIWFPAE